MKHEAVDARSNKHLSQTQLLPWYVNGTLDEAQRLTLERHLAECAICRADLALEREVHASMTVADPIEYIPTVSLQRLRARLHSQSDQRAPRSGDLSARGWRWPATIAASIGLLALAVGMIVVDHRHDDDRGASAPYHTVTNARATVPGEVIRAVFAPNTTLVELQALLDEAQLRIVAGPTEAGVYSLAATTSRPIAASLSTLRHDPAVRFAESTQPDARTGGPK